MIHAKISEFVRARNQMDIERIVESKTGGENSISHREVHVCRENVPITGGAYAHAGLHSRVMRDAGLKIELHNGGMVVLIVKVTTF